MNILILGSKSFIGRYIFDQLKKKFNIFTLNSYFDEVDILKLNNREFVEKYFNHLNTKIDVIINLIYIHKNNLNDELNLNLNLVDKICFFVNQKKIRIIHISSVNSSGSNRDNKYSYTKSSLEKKIIGTDRYTILRLSTVIFKDKDNNFIGGRNGNSLNVFNFFIKKLRIFPLINNGDFTHTVCFLNDLDKFIDILIRKELFLNERINFFTGQYITLKQLIRFFSKSYNLRIYFLNIPNVIIQCLVNISKILDLKFISEQKLKNLLEQNIEYDKSIEIERYIKLKKID